MEKIEFGCDNLGGIAKIYAVPISSFVKMQRNWSLGINRAILQNRENIVEFDVFSTANYVEKMSQTDAGQAYEQAISGIVTGVDRAKKVILDRLCGESWLVIWQDVNAKWWLSGTEDVPMSFSYERATGTSPADASAMRFKFSAVCATAAELIEVASM